MNTEGYSFTRENLERIAQLIPQTGVDSRVQRASLSSINRVRRYITTHCDGKPLHRVPTVEEIGIELSNRMRYVRALVDALQPLLAGRWVSPSSLAGELSRQTAIFDMFPANWRSPYRTKNLPRYPQTIRG